VIELNPDNANAYNNKGSSLMNLGKKEEAIECYSKSIEINPNYLTAYNNKGKALIILRKFKMAYFCIKKSI
jgi:tetratricopeptide (TPR) repeat protein